MSKVKIQGNASGTGVITLEAPNTNTDRTITLPDGDISFGVGIDDNATSTAITIDASENVGVGVTPTQKLHVKGRLLVERDVNANENLSIYQSGGYHYLNVQEGTSTAGTLIFTKGTSNDETFRITSDGRGLSQFTAKAWVNFNGTGTVAIRDSHNVSSITDNGTGQYQVNFTNAMANSNYNAVSSGKFYSWDSSYLIESTTTSYLQIASVRSSNNTYEDTPIITAIVFGD